MPIDIIARSLDWSRQRETLILMDDYGATFTKILSFSETDRAAAIAATKAMMLANETAAVTYATTAGYLAPTALSFAQKQTQYTTQGGPIALVAASS